MKAAMRKDVFREIKHTFGRFMGILTIVALGVAFFSGLGATGIDMKLTGDDYFDSQELMDIRVISTYGLTEKDLKAIAAAPGVNAVNPAYSMDALVMRNEESYILKVHSITSLNGLVLLYGRMPENRAEALVEADFIYRLGVSVGDVVTLRSGVDTDIRASLRTDKFRIVGVVRSPYYVSRERGSGSIGDGSIDYFCYIPPENFLQSVYSEAFVSVDGASEFLCFDDAYEDAVGLAVDAIEEIAKKREDERYQELTDRAFKELQGARVNLRMQSSKSQLELDEAEKALLDTASQISSAWFDQTMNQAEITEALRDLELQEMQIQSGLYAIRDAENLLDSSSAQLKSSQRELDDASSELDGQELELLRQMSLLSASDDTEEKAYAKLRISDARAKIVASRIEMESSYSEITAGLKSIAAQRDSLQAEKAALQESLEKIKEGRDSLIAAQNNLLMGITQTASARRQLDSSTIEFLASKNKASKALADAQSDIDSAQKALDNLDKPKWYVLDRQSNPGYAGFSQDSDKIAAIGRVFPLLFFLVAALVSLTTMTRLVEERRGEIGTLKSLGYSNMSIISKYVIYAAVPTLVGGFLGGYAGMKLFPSIIINAYNMLYSMPKTLTPMNYSYWGAGVGLAFFCTIFAAVFSCVQELGESPSSLMRPKAPKIGRRSFIEMIPLFWSSLSFTQKVTLRNIIRYKKRFYMTVIGIAGCTALLLTGFGIKDSIAAIMDLQYKDICVYDMSVSFAESAKQRDITRVGDTLMSSGAVSGQLRLYEKSMDAGNPVRGAGSADRTFTLIVPESMDALAQFIIFRDRETRKAVKADSEGVVITEKLSGLLEIYPGDGILIKDGDEYIEATVSAVTENYFFHYIYMPKELYAALYGKEPEYNSVIAKMSPSIGETEPSAKRNNLAGEVLEEKSVNAVSFTQNTIDSFNDILSNLNFVVIVLIISAGALALVVLLNLSSINISERMRELATIEVLGFTDKEVSAYVFRESAVLSAIGALAGLILGKSLHLYIMLSVETDIMMFGRSILPMSFVWSLALTAAFSICANLFSSRRLRQIHMVEALKSVE
ncbi:MAG: ABC transporter permease [Clostridiales bacterium]|nr:ABC transporter permease [Clostridiales bacterium]